MVRERERERERETETETETETDDSNIHCTDRCRWLKIHCSD